METIEKLNGINALSIKEQLAICEILDNSFEQKFAILKIKTPKEGKDIWLKDLLTFKKGLLYRKDGDILGVAILASKENPCFCSLTKLIKRLGLIKGILAKLWFTLEAVKSDKTLKLEFVAVKPTARGLGVGKKLLNRLFELTAEEGFEELALEVVDTNPRAKKLYQNLGFKTVKSVNTKFFTKRMGFEVSDTMIKTVTKYK